LFESSFHFAEYWILTYIFDNNKNIIMSKKRLIASIIDNDEDSSQPTPSCRNRMIDSILNKDLTSSRPSAICLHNRSVSDILNEELSTLNQISSIYESSEDDLEDILWQHYSCLMNH